MAMTIGTNTASLAAARSLHESGKAMQTAMERLSSGLRINSASDDAAGMAVVTELEAQQRSLDAAVKNISNGTALTSTIEASLDEVSDMLLRMRELAVQAANDTYSTSDRAVMHNEMVALRNEIDAVSTRVEFGGLKLLDGSFSGKLIQVGESSGETITVTQDNLGTAYVGGDKVTGNLLGAALSTNNTANTTALIAARANTMDFDITYTDGSGASVSTSSDYGDAAADDAKAQAAEVNADTATHGVTATATTAALLVLGTNTTGTSTTASLNLELGELEGSLTAIDEFVGVAAGVAAINAKSSTTGITARATTTANQIILTDIDGDNIIVQNMNDGTTDKNTLTMDQYSDGEAAAGAVTITDQTVNGGNAAGDNDTGIVIGQLTLTSNDSFSVTGGGADSLVAPSTTTSSTTNAVSTASLATQSGAQLAIATFDGAVASVADMKADLGAVVNRLSHAMDTAIVMRDMVDQAAATIRDADYSVESARLAKAQVQQQVGTAMLAQANAAPQLVLQLIQ